MIAFFNSFHVSINEADTPVGPQSASEALISLSLEVHLQGSQSIPEVSRGCQGGFPEEGAT